MVNEQELTATSSNAINPNSGRNDEKYTENHMIISDIQPTPEISPSSSLSCSMGQESNLTAIGISPHPDGNTKQTSLSEVGGLDARKAIDIQNESNQSISNMKDTQPVQKKRGRGGPREQEKELNYQKEEESGKSIPNSINSLDKEQLGEGYKNDTINENSGSLMSVCQEGKSCLPSLILSSECPDANDLESSNIQPHLPNCQDGNVENLRKTEQDMYHTTMLSAKTESLDISDNSNRYNVENSASKSRSSTRLRERSKLDKVDDNEQKSTNIPNKMYNRNGKMPIKNTSGNFDIAEGLHNGHSDQKSYDPCATSKMLNGFSMGTMSSRHKNIENSVRLEEDSSSQESKEISDSSRDGSLRGENDLNVTFPLKVKSRWHNASQNEMIKDTNATEINDTEPIEPYILKSTSSENRNDYHVTHTLDSTVPTKQKRETRSRSERRTSSKRTSPTEKDVLDTNDKYQVRHKECNDTSSEAVKDYSSKEIVTPAQQLEVEQRLTSFDHIASNTFICQRRRNKQTRDMECDCSLSKEDIAVGKKGCGDDCLNRLLMVECNKSCSLGDNCGNKRFQNLENALTEVFKTEYKGVGLRAAAPIGRDSFIMEYVGEVLDPQRFHKRAKKYSQNEVKHFYFMALSTEYIIDATSKGNISRFINHSCDPNAETQKWTVDGELRVGFFSRRKIKPGEEITFDYKYERYGQNAQKCYCGATNCRGWLGGKPEKDDPESSDEETPEQEEESSLSSDGQDETESVMHYDKIECDTSSPIEDPGFSPKVSPIKLKKYNKRRLRRTTRKIKNFETDEFEEEIERLKMTGIRTKSHTVDLCRLMVRVTETKTRLTLCHLLLDADSPCRRLFLDYHGLKILNSWMADLKWDSLIDLDVKIALEDVLSILNIPHKTMLVESNIWHSVTSWATADISKKAQANSSYQNESLQPDSSNTVLSTNCSIPSSQSQSRVTEMEIDSTTSKMSDKNHLIPTETCSSPIADELSILQKLRSINQKLSENTIEKEDKINETTNSDFSNVTSSVPSTYDEISQHALLLDSRPMETDNKEKSVNLISNTDQEIDSKASIVKEKAQSLLNIWESLKEVFKIPRKELIKLRAEHEKELEDAEKHLKKNPTHIAEDTKFTGVSNFNQHRFGFGNAANNKFGYERNRPAFRPHSPPPPPKHRETRCSRFDDKTGRLNSSGLSRDHRRFYISQKFEMEKEEKRKRDLLQAWHENKCYYLRLDPSITPMFPEIPEFYFDPTVGTWYQMPELPPQVDVWGKLGFPHMALLPKDAYRDTDSPLPDPTLIYPPGVVKVSYLYGQPMSLDPSFNNAQIDIPEPEPTALPPESAIVREASDFTSSSCLSLPLSYIDPDTGQEIPIPEEQHLSNTNLVQLTGLHTIPASNSSVNEYNSDLISPIYPGVSDQCNASQYDNQVEFKNTLPPTNHSYQTSRCNSVSPSSIQLKPSTTNISCKREQDGQGKIDYAKRKPGNVIVKLPSSWRVTRDSGGKVYYYNIQTKEVQWVPPKGTETLQENGPNPNQARIASQASHQIDVLGATPESEDDEMDGNTKMDSPMDEDGDESDIDEDDETDLNIDMDLDAKSLDNPQGPCSDLSAQERNILLRFSKLSKEERQNERRQKRERDREKKEYERKRRRERHGKHRKDGLVTEHLIPKRGEREKTDLMTFQEMRERLANRDAIREKQEIEEREEAERDREEEKKRLRQIEKDRREQQAAEKQATADKKAAQNQALMANEHSSNNENGSSPAPNTSVDQVVQNSEDRTTSSFEQTSKTTTAAADTSSEVSKKVKENFMKEVSKIIVKVLDPFRKADAQKAKIQTIEDFKHLAKKLTEYILLKEMKHCPRVEDLRFTESVKKKTAEFVRKYMLKFGDTYTRSPQKY